MDSTTLLDYALFQLTPTRTRCDLVIFAGKKNEKIASGLLEPFLSHLKSAKDQISRGGYSITLQPKTAYSSPWFTKATLERFVRFVSTPEVLERFVTIEREIDQIESSIESNEQANGTVDVQGIVSGTYGDPALSKSKESSSNGDAEPEEKPKIQLQRVLESRKAMLKKEQAMAYARALVGGFEMDYIYDLVSFSDAFGAMRLREACINFMELCKRKNEDKIWMDEVAAMQASYMGTPALILGGENNNQQGSMDTNEGTGNSSPMEFNVQVQQTEGVAQLPTWPSHLPQYMQNTQGPMFQQIPHYPGYAFPGMYPSNVPWPANFQDPSAYLDREIKDSHRYKRSTKKQDKNAMKNSERIETDPSDSSDEQDQVHNKKHKKHSSRKVVIRNINYITSGRNEESNSASDGDSYDEDEYVKEHHKQSKNTSNKIKIGVDIENEGTTNFKEEKKDGNWDIFQNILMKDLDSKFDDMGSKTVNVQEEHSMEKAYEEEKFSSSDKKLDKPKYTSDAFLLTERSTGNGIDETNVKFEGGEDFHGVIKGSSKNEELLVASRIEGEYYLQKNAHLGTESSIAKIQKEEDWLIGSKREISDGRTDHTIFCGDHYSANHKRDIILDDSFMVQSRLSDGPLESQPKADIYMVSDIDRANSMPGNLQGKVESSNFYEPEELYMMLGRGSAAEQVVASWNPEIDYENENLQAEQVVESNGNSNESNIKASIAPGKKVDGKGVKSKAPSGSLRRSKSDTPTRSKVPTGGSRMVMSKAEKEEDKRKKLEELRIQRQKRIAERSAAKVITRETSTRSSKTDKTKLQGPNGENKKSHKPLMRSSTIDRLATARTSNKKVSTESKATQNGKATSKANVEMKTASLKKTKAPVGQDNVNSSDQRKGTINLESNSPNVKEIDWIGTVPSILHESTSAEVIEGQNGIQDFGSVKVLHTVTSVEKIEANRASDDKNCIQDNVDDHVGLTPQMTVNPTVRNHLESTELNNDENGDEKKKISFSPEISVVHISKTPPPNDETNSELVPSRKKWNNGESSPKAPKGFRKLLLFGRKS
ncbi:hypothetical protein BUALT_Bualt18G0053800 [Buddleja alternifolia]|uniref:COP1-interacting protein 7 n=1 Tax=Buddleja alternifolia TaxID=168488 RepID=A0AAV6WB88_9LAMI|nr:hypothetical protein BUALT_Bualt18G0053800 [Buddleja alternifolia]